MATVYSLVCFGGRLGKTVAFTDVGDICNVTNHGLRPGTGVVFSTDGTLPTGITEGVTYYARQVTDNNKFLLYATAADAIAGTGQILFYGIGTGTHKVKSAWMLSLPSLSRWGSPGSERIYDGLVSWNSGRSGASAFDIEVCEIGESFTELITAAFTVNIPSAKNLIHTRIGDARSDAYHGGHVPGLTLATLALTDGYALYAGSGVGGGAMIKLTRYRDEIDGIIVLNVSSGSVGYGVDLGTQCRAANCMVLAAYASPVATGTFLRSALGEVSNCVIAGWVIGSAFGSSQLGIQYNHNIVTKCTNGLTSVSTVSGFFYNNIVVGNVTVNWPTTQPTSLEGADGNAGLSGNAWVTGSGSRVTIATTDFAAYGSSTLAATDDFRPASSSSPQVETGVPFYGYQASDVADRFRPDYMGGGAAVIDIGPYEFDHGYGPWPITSTLTLTNVVVGSSYRVEDTSDDSLIDSGTAAGSSVAVTVPWLGAPRTLRVKVRKASTAPKYQPFETSAVVGLTDTSTYITQVPDTIAS